MGWARNFGERGPVGLVPAPPTCQGLLTCMAKNKRPNLRTLQALPRYLYSFKIYNLQGPEKDVSNDGSSHWSAEVVVGGHFFYFLLEDDGSSSVGSTAPIATSFKGPTCRMRRGAQKEPIIWYLRG